MDRIGRLIALYHSTNPVIKKRALFALTANDDPRIPAILLDGFEKFGPHVDVIAAMKRSQDPNLVEPLIHYLSHPDFELRRGACEVLGELHDERATLPLLDCLSDDDLWVRRLAASALGRLRDPRAITNLTHRYTEHPDDDINVCMALDGALNALGVIHDKPTLWKKRTE